MKNYQKIFLCLCLSLMLKKIITAETIIELKEPEFKKSQVKTELTSNMANYILKVKIKKIDN
jgi:hypothetical protein